MKYTIVRFIYDVLYLQKQVLFSKVPLFKRWIIISEVWYVELSAIYTCDKQGNKIIPCYCGWYFVKFQWLIRIQSSRRVTLKLVVNLCRISKFLQFEIRFLLIKTYFYISAFYQVFRYPKFLTWIRINEVLSSFSSTVVRNSFSQWCSSLIIFRTRWVYHMYSIVGTCLLLVCFRVAF